MLRLADGVRAPRACAHPRRSTRRPRSRCRASSPSSRPRDVPHNRYGLIDADQPVLCDDIVRHYGDRVALVAAETDLAARAWRRTRCASSTTTSRSSPIRAPRCSPASPRVHARSRQRLAASADSPGDTASAFDAADVVVEGRFTTQWQEHAYLQPDAGIAYFDRAGPHRDRDGRTVAARRPPADRRDSRHARRSRHRALRRRSAARSAGARTCRSRACVALATWMLQRPSAIRWNREESIIGHHKRHPFFITAKWGAKRDGTIVAVETTLVADGGAYASTSVEVLKGAMTFAHGPYDVANVSVDGYRLLHQQRTERRVPRLRRSASAFRRRVDDHARRARAAARSARRAPQEPLPRRQPQLVRYRDAARA